MNYKIIRNAAGDVVCFGPNTDQYQPGIPAGATLTVEASIPPKPLSEVKAAKLTQLEQARDTETFKDVTALGSTWQADERSQKNLNDKLTNCLLGRPLPPVWRDKDNNNLIVTNIAQLVAIAGAMEDQTQAAYVKSWTLKAQVNAATTSAEVDAVVW